MVIISNKILPTITLSRGSSDIVKGT